MCTSRDIYQHVWRYINPRNNTVHLPGLSVSLHDKGSKNITFILKQIYYGARCKIHMYFLRLYKTSKKLLTNFQPLKGQVHSPPSPLGICKSILLTAADHTNRQQWSTGRARGKVGGFPLKPH